MALLFTSAHSGDGTTTVAGNYAVLNAATGRSTLLIDANLSRPALHEEFGMDSRPGVTDVVVGGYSLDDTVTTTTVGGTEMFFLPAGTPVDGTADVLGSPQAHDLISSACEKFDSVVIDTPSVLAVTDAAVLAAHPEVDTIVVVARNQRHKRVAGTITQLQRAGASVIGLALNSG